MQLSTNADAAAAMSCARSDVMVAMSGMREGLVVAAM